MNRTELIAYLAIPMPSNEPFEHGTDRSRTALYATLEELCGLSSQLPLELYDYGTHSPIIGLVDHADIDTKLRKWFRPNTLDCCDFVSFAIEVDFSDDIYTDAEGNKLPIGAHRCAIQHMFLKRISDVLVCSNLCRVGSIELRESVVLQDGQVQEYTELPRMDSWALQRAVELSLEIGWPELKTLPFPQVWEWVNQQDCLLEGFERGPTGRALAAFSRLFEPGSQDEAMELVWAMVGIEALYVHGKVSVTEQVREKVQCFLGRQDAYKKRIVEMYEFRSRFMHGDLDFPPLYLMGDAAKPFERYQDRQIEAVNLGVAILAASLQELIHRNWAGVDFSYTPLDPGFSTR